jgi:Flp pilus assembly protein TadD
VTALLVLLIANSAYLAALPQANLLYIANIPVHLILGTLVCAILIWQSKKSPKIIPLLLAALIGLYLIPAGATTDHYKILIAHIALAIAGLALIKPRYTLTLATLTFIAAALRLGLPKDRIANPTTIPTAMTEEGEGPKSPFWPSSSRTSVGGIMPSDFFMESQQCGECHKDIYQQWKSSMHHFASFNNQFYKATILHMQDLSGTQGSKWCAGCHDHAVFFNGRFEIPIKQQVDTPEAQNGLGCVSCHSITHVGSTMGNADFEITYPPLHRLAASKNSFIQASEKFITYLNPEPHRRTFMKPFMREPEFCSACHKVHLDQPVNHYRWLRGFNDYDNWQASGVSGQGARSFYYPTKSQACADCHMPQVPSQDPGNHNGLIHSHRFAAANTAIPTVNHDYTQEQATETFLKSGFITVDLFSASPIESTQKGELQMKRRAEIPTLASTFAVGEEAEQPGPITLREVGKIAAPIDASGIALSPGSTVRIDAVVRTRKIGHFFPAGTVDSVDVWLEFSARDATGRLLAQSGAVADNGPVDPSAHFYRSYLLDGEGNPIDKRNAWQARSVFYVHLIPPGAADTVHYRVDIPKDAAGPITFEAKLNYRKFTDYYTRFSFASNPPVLPIITLARATAKVNIASGAGPCPAKVGQALPPADCQWKPIIRPQDRERWNDWGIGLLLQGDLKAAEYAFHRVTEADPSYPDAYVNIARALIQEGETESARPFLEKALALSPNLARAEFFLASIQKTAGDYDGALKSLTEARRQYPRDRVVVDQVGRILFLQRHYAEAVSTFKTTLTIDPEDLEAHYNLMLCYRGLGQLENAEREQKLFLRFKADESSQSLTEKPRLAHPEENNERQPIHDHDSLPPLITKRL